ncbi:Maf family protein [Aliidiomarina sp.]|uniref:Maf family protein n=1 Tax=Aliidiomarina sp. TaxID=1872439 RepID=UPI003A4D6D7F
MHTLVLASASPRRKELLALLQVPFVTEPANIAEQQVAGESPADYVQRLAAEKAAAVASNHPEFGVLGSDTIVVAGDTVMEKPTDFTHFSSMMQRLSGATHQVLTAVALHTPVGKWQTLVTTQVTFRNLSSTDIAAYWQTGEPHDKAGGYGIQGLAGKFVSHISGSYFAVVGLPLYETEQLLQQWQAITDNNQ